MVDKSKKTAKKFVSVQLEQQNGKLEKPYINEKL